MLEREAKQVIFLFLAHGTYRGPTVCASQGKAAGIPPALSGRDVRRARALRQAVLSLRCLSGLSLLPNHFTIPCTQQESVPILQIHLFIHFCIYYVSRHEAPAVYHARLRDKQLRARTARDGRQHCMLRGPWGGPLRNLVGRLRSLDISVIRAEF